MAEHIRITARPGHFDPRELWRSRDLILLLAKKRVLLGYKQTVLGPAWVLVQPLLTAWVYGLVFGELAGLGTDGMARLPFYLSGTAIWSFFSQCVTGNALCFRENADLFGKVRFPRLAVPVANLLAASFTLAIQLALAAATAGAGGAGLLLLPVPAVMLGLLGTGVGLMISALTVRFRDLHILVHFGMQLWMYASPILYPAALTPGWLRLNPVAPPVRLLRAALTGQDFPPAGELLLAGILTGAALAAGIFLFTRAEHTFLDTV